MWENITNLENEPTHEVLAANFKPGTYGFKEKLYGFVSYSDEEECFICQSEGVILENVTHFIDVDLIPKPV